MIPGLLVFGTTLKLSVSAAYISKWLATQIEKYDPVKAPVPTVFMNAFMFRHRRGCE